MHKASKQTIVIEIEFVSKEETPIIEKLNRKITVDGKVEYTDSIQPHMVEHDRTPIEGLRSWLQGHPNDLDDLLKKAKKDQDDFYLKLYQAMEQVVTAGWPPTT
jgi:hypothetical protein